MAAANAGFSEDDNNVASEANRIDSNGKYHSANGGGMEHFERIERGKRTGPMAAIQFAQSTISHAYEKHNTKVQGVIGIILAVLVHIYLGMAISYDFNKALALLVLVSLTWIGLIYYKIIVPLFSDVAYNTIYIPIERVFTSVWKLAVIRWLVYLLILAAFGAFLYFDTVGSRVRLVSLGGLVVYVIIGFVLSNNPAKIQWRPVLWGLALQFVLGLLVLRWETGNQAFKFASDQVVRFLEYTTNGTTFVYGFLASPPNICGMENAVFAFTALQTVIYFGSIVSVLYYWGVIQFVLVRIAWLMQFTMGTTAAESLNAAACIFLGQTESALLIKPALLTMTPSEVHAIMTAGFACIAGSLFAAYIRLGACPEYLLSATVMSAPASLAIAKLIEEKNVIECISNGAVASVEYVAAIIANLIVFLALVAFIDSIIGWLGAMIGYPDVTLIVLLGYAFYPLALVMGTSDSDDASVRVAETLKVAELMGIKTVLNEFFAYLKLGDLIRANAIGKRAQMISIYALCGFSNISTIGSQLGILGSLCPQQKSVYARVAIRALIAGSIACFMTACVAGVLVPEPTSCRPAGFGNECTPIG